jgi:hypothetical protein
MIRSPLLDSAKHSAAAKLIHTYKALRRKKHKDVMGFDIM